MTPKSVIPAQAGIQKDKNAFRFNPLDSRLRGNDVAGISFSEFHSGGCSVVFNYGNLNKSTAETRTTETIRLSSFGVHPCF